MSKRQEPEPNASAPVQKPESNWAIRQRKARERREARLAAQHAKEQEWRARVAAHFGFLETEFGCHFVSVDASNWWATNLIYQNETTRINIARSVESGYVEIWLIRLIDGQEPPFVIFFLPDSDLYRDLLDNVVKLHAPDLLPRVNKLRGLEDAQVEAALPFLADLTRTYAAPLLRGDFTDFETLQAAYRENARTNPPKVTIWKATDATPEEVAKQMQPPHKTDDGLVIETRYYPSAARRKHDKAEAQQAPATSKDTTSDS